MGFLGKWLARSGNVGETARAVGLGWNTIKAKQPKLKSKGIAKLYVQIRYGATGEPELAKTVLSELGRGDVSPFDLTWAILSVENDFVGLQDGVPVSGKQLAEWRVVVREELSELGF